MSIQIESRRLPSKSPKARNEEARAMKKKTKFNGVECPRLHYRRDWVRAMASGLRAMEKSTKARGKKLEEYNKIHLGDLDVNPNRKSKDFRPNPQKLEQ